MFFIFIIRIKAKWGQVTFLLLLYLRASDQSAT